MAHTTDGANNGARAGRLRHWARQFGSRPIESPARFRPVPLLLGLVALLVGALLFVSVDAFGFSAPSPKFVSTPVVTSARFTVPSGSSRTWTLKLWSQGKLLGTDSGSGGTLSVPIPTSTCVYQADVRIVGVNGKSYWTSGNRTTASCCPARAPTAIVTPPLSPAPSSPGAATGTGRVTAPAAGARRVAGGRSEGVRRHR